MGIQKKQLNSTMPLIREEMRIPDVTNVKGLISLISQPIEENESFHLDLVMASLVRIHPSVKPKDATCMIPAFEQARLIAAGQVEGVGDLDILLASFLIDYAGVLFQEFEGCTPEFYEFYVNNLQAGSRTRSKKAQQSYRDYKPYWELAKRITKQIRERNTLPLLSTPTHRPAWIDPEILVSRLLEYQKVNAKPDNLDFQIALSRVALDRPKDALRLANKELTGEYRELLLFLLDPKARPKGRFTQQALWMTAGLVKSPETVYEEFAGFPYSSVNRAYLTGDIPCDVFVFEKPFGKVDRILQLLPPPSKNVQIQRRFGGYALYVTYRPCSRIPLLVETFWKMSLREKDWKRILLLSPNAPQVLLALLVRDRVRDAYWNDTELSQLNLVTLDTLRELDFRWGKMAKTYLAICLLSVNKTVRTDAAELWAELVKKEKMDSFAVGQILGEIQSHEWSPVHRFAGLVTEDMLNISPRHNRELESLLVSFLSCLPETPVKDLKRLLEAFTEVLAVNQSKVMDESLLSLLRKWGENSKLQEIIEKIV